MYQLDIEKTGTPTRAARDAAAAPRRLLIVSHVRHYAHAGRLYAYGPYAREVDIWADLFPEVVIAAPYREQIPPADCLPFTRANISVHPQPETGGKNLRTKAAGALLLPALVLGLCRAMRNADAIHVRFPASIGLMGILLAPLFSPRLVAKYAGQWNGYTGERFVLRLQRRLLASRWWRGPVTVYGAWQNQPPHVVPFFTSMMTAEQVEHATVVAKNKKITSPLRVLFSGRLAPEKRVEALLRGVSIVSEAGIEIEVAIVGDGIERARLEALAVELGIKEKVVFHGARPFDEAMRWYEWAHCLVLPSTNSEGWPKVIAEGMCHGLVCVAVAHGQVPTMLRGRGILLDAGTPEEIATALREIAEKPASFEPVMRAAHEWSRQYSLEDLRAALGELLSERWNVSLPYATTRK